MSENEQVKGKVGFEEPSNKKEVITKEESMFQVDDKGNAISELVEIEVYDRNLDKEMIEEALLLMQAEKNSKAINKVYAQVKSDNDAKVNKYKADLDNLNLELKNEKDDTKKKEIVIKIRETKELIAKIVSGWDTESIKRLVSNQVVNDSIEESKDIIKQLEDLKQKQIVKKYAKLCPCTVSQSIYAFEKGLTIEGKPTDDWVSDLIVNKCKEPQYTLEEAKLLNPNYKSALKEALMEISHYNNLSYRDYLTQSRLMKKPLTRKKL